MQKVFLGALTAVATGLGLTACQEPGPDAVADAPPALTPAATLDEGCADSAFVRGRILGAIEADIDWTQAGLACAGGPRPDGEGARLRFAKTLDGGPGLTVIIALPALKRRITGKNLLANVTVIVEGEARFFSTQNRETCWADVTDNENSGDERYAVEGELYCIGALAEVNGNGSVTIDGLQFRGTVDWGSS